MASTRASSKRSADGEVSAAKRSKSKYSSDNMLTVLVGPQEESFTVHKSTICAKSPFFEAACSGRWPKAKDGIVRLPEAEVDAFEVFLNFVYADKLDLKPMQDRKEPKYCHLWNLANYLQCHKLCNKVIDRILWSVGPYSENPSLAKIWPSEHLQEAWELLTEGIKLRDLVVHLVLAYASSEDFSKTGEYWPQDVLLAIVKQHLDEKGETKNIRTLPPRQSSRAQQHDYLMSGGLGHATAAALPPITARIKPSFETSCEYHEHDENTLRCDAVFDDEEADDEMRMKTRTRTIAAWLRTCMIEALGDSISVLVVFQFKLNRRSERVFTATFSSS